MIQKDIVSSQRDNFITKNYSAPRDYSRGVFYAKNKKQG